MGFYVNLCDKNWCIYQDCHNPAVLKRGQKVAFPSVSSKAKIILWRTFYLLPIWGAQKRNIQRRFCHSNKGKRMKATCPYQSFRILSSKKSINYAHQVKNIIILHIENEITSTIVCLQSKIFSICWSFCVFLTCTAMKVRIWGLSLDLDHLQMLACLLLNLMFITLVQIASPACLLLLFNFAY